MKLKLVLIVLALTSRAYSMDEPGEEAKKRVTFPTPGQQFERLIAAAEQNPTNPNSKLILAARDSFVTAMETQEGKLKFNLAPLREEFAAQTPKAQCPKNKKYAVLVGTAVGGYLALRGTEWIVRRK